MSPMKAIVIGAGGHAAVVADALLAAGTEVLGFTDTDTALHGSMLCGLPVLGDDRALLDHDPGAVWLANGLGSLGNQAQPLRQRVQEHLESQGWRFCQVVHPGAIVSRFARLGAAAQVMAGAVVQPGASIAAGVIINTRAVVEHDADIGAWSHVAPGAVVCGQAVIGSGSHVGAGAVVRQGLHLGAHTLLGAGAVAVADFSGDGVLIGVPAHPLEASK